MDRKVEDSYKKDDFIQSWINSSNSIGSSSENHDSESTVSSSFACDMLTLSKELVDSRVHKSDSSSQSFISSTELQNFGNLNIQQSRKIHIGNNFYLNRVVVTNVTQSPAEDKKSTELPRPETTSEIHRNITTEAGAFISQPLLKMDETVLQIVPRRLWLAQPPIKVELLKKPVSFVIVGHTATESGSTPAEMILMVRIIQQFHVESRMWDDIAYNFLVGGDGNVYEGRGFDHVCNHPYSHKKKGIIISFVGCFSNHLPTKSSLDLCKLLIQKGVEDGHVAHDYKLLAHCQCSPTESPGKMLFEEIKTWPHWSESISD